jgi:hypothetical protein
MAIDRASGLTLSITTNLLACFSRLGSIEFYSFHNTGGRPTQNSHSEVDTNTHLASILIFITKMKKSNAYSGR